MLSRFWQSFSLLICLTPSIIAQADSEYVGNEACTGCHSQAGTDWYGSHHDLAMQEANTNTVLGNFNNASFSYGSVTSRFYKKDGQFWVDTDNEQGQMQSYPVAYVFGVYPLQQLLLATGAGRLQALSVAWDARDADTGGQRWYHIYADQEPITAGDPLHWTGPYHNWNTRCAECHSTNVKKHYNASTRTFATEYDQIDVGCEACHGPGRRHVLAAKDGTLDGLSNVGFAMSLAARGQWYFPDGSAIARRKSVLEANTQIDNCGRCHARRSTLGDYHYGADLLDTHRLATLDANLYYPDGQIRDEVYVYGSFIQSKMYQAGVVCSNCHNPHSNALYADGNAICAQCHDPSVYDHESHHRHAKASSGAACVECHMPDRLYMGVDWRRDHSMRIPRPDLSLTTGSPNACNLCHEDQTASWALSAMKDWGIDFPDTRTHPARAFHSAQRGDMRSLPSLKSIATDPSKSTILRASAIEHYGQFGTPDLPQTVAMLLRSDDALLRASAVRASASVPVQQRYLLLRTLIDDEILGVRMAVAEQLAATPRAALRPKDLPQLDALFAEYEAVQSQHLDMPSVQVQLANFWIAQGHLARAEQALIEALRINPQLAVARANLADLLRQTNREQEGRALLLAGIALMPEAGVLDHTLGLLEIRAGNTDQALLHLKRAADSERQGSRHRYVYAVALHDTGRPKEAIALLEKVNQERPGNIDVLYALIGYTQSQGDSDKTGRYQSQLRAVGSAAGL